MEFFDLRKEGEKFKRAVYKIVDSILWEKYDILPIPDLHDMIYENYIKMLNKHITVKQIFRIMKKADLSEFLSSISVDVKDLIKDDMIEFIETMIEDKEREKYSFNEEDDAIRKKEILSIMTKVELQRIASNKEINDFKGKKAELVEVVSKFPIRESFALCTNETLTKIKKKIDARPLGKTKQEKIDNIMDYY